MTNIIYVTTAMDEKDFKEYITHWMTPPNPSNQNFHNKMIRCLAISHHVDVISIRPYSRKLCDTQNIKKNIKIDGNITWHYISISRYFFIKLLNIRKEVNEIIKEIMTPNTIVFTDTINSGIVNTTKHIIKKTKRANKVIGVVTDSPSNISGVGRSYTNYILSNANKYDGYISLTKELGELYNPSNKPNIVVEGLVEDRKIKGFFDKNVKYFFFGGALMERYGIYELIKAFNELSKKHERIFLIIAGHHADENRLLKAIGPNVNIRYLKMLPVEDVLMYEQHAIANINPRPFSEDLDRYSIPSKTLEYLVSGVPTICVKNTKLAKYFQEEIIWAKSSESKDLLEAMDKVITCTKDIYDTVSKNGKEKALNYFSLKAVNKRIDEELLAILDK